jgi:biotin transport system substrate-specific component
MSKRVEKQLNSFKYNGEPIKITLGTLVMTGLCVILIIVATFTQITIKHPYLPLDSLSYLAQDLSDYEVLHHFIKKYQYIPQIPVVFFIVALMGRRFGMLAIISYIILGLFFPIFALGGGIDYLFEYGFGYILAFLPAIFFAGTILKGKPDFLRVLMVSVVGVLIIHILGILYMLFIATLRHASAEMITSWIISQSGIQIIYDIIFTLVGIYLGKQVRKLLWIVMC